MALETAVYISELDVNNPQSTDSIAQADNHMRMIKYTLKNTFPNINGAITKTDEQINDLLEKAGGTMTGPLVLSGAPTTNLNAATKLYVDTADALKADKAITVTTDGGLSGGGDLTANRVITLSDAGVSTAKIADNAVTTAKIAADNVTNAKLAADAVTSAKIANGAVTTAKIASNAITDHVDFTGANQSKTANGYQKLPGGLIIQWGFIADAGTTATITFPIAFSTACYSVQANVVHPGDTNGLSAVPGLTSTPSTTGVTLSTVSGRDHYWLAIGY